MIDYNAFHFATDLRAIREILGLSQAELAARLGVQQVTVSRNESGKTRPQEKLLEQVYSFAFQNGVQLNRLEEMLWEENLAPRSRLLFHGAKSAIEGMLRADAGRANNDFGVGFYTGETYEQAVSFVSGFEKSSVYLLQFDEEDLICRRYGVDQDWMMTIAYYRGALARYAGHPAVEKLVAASRDCDYIIAPIADNRMFQIIHSFIEGEITDEQCRHCLAATNLGSQYVMISDKAVSRVKILERCYLSGAEKEYYRHARSADTKLGDDKVRLARSRYRGQGRYIDEILA